MMYETRVLASMSMRSKIISRVCYIEKRKTADKPCHDISRITKSDMCIKFQFKINRYDTHTHTFRRIFNTSRERKVLLRPQTVTWT